MSVKIGDTVTSKVTGSEIIVTKIYPFFIKGMLKGFVKPFYRGHDGTVILSYKNIEGLLI